MEDEEEIDIIGDYDDISKISSGQLLSCDYTVHPKWVNENAEGGNFWSESVPKHENLENNVEVLHSEEVVIEEPGITNKNILDLEWASEIISQSDDVVFEDDIPATTEEVVEDDECKEFLEEEINSRSQDKNILPNDCSSNEWEENVAAFEIHPPPKNIKYIGPTNSRSLLKVKMENQVFNIPNPRSLLKKHHVIKNNENKLTKFKRTLTISKNIFEKVSKSKETKNESEKEKTKFKQSVTIGKAQAKNFKIVKTANTSNTKIQNLHLSTDSQRVADLEKSIIVSQPKKGIKVKKNAKDYNFGENITIIHDSERILNKKFEISRQISNIPTNTHVKLQKIESDEEVDIEADLCEDEIIDLKKSLFGTNVYKIAEQIQESSQLKNQIATNEEIMETENKQNDVKIENFLKISDDLAFEIRKNLETPKQELILNASDITDLEKYFNPEFFDGKSNTKTPDQYLRIRNHILTMWNVMGKNGYVSKTSVRNGLKHGGDVNSISRIHRLLEQIGAINFGYQGKYFEYVRPLEEYFSMFLQNKCQYQNIDPSNGLYKFSNKRTQRIRTRTNQFILENGDKCDSNTNFTIEHQNEKHVIMKHVKVINIKHIKTEKDLVRCQKFSKYNLAPFKVSITLSTLLCVGLHSLSSKYEVMGFLGGHRSKSIGRNKMCLTRYKPCKTIEHSGTMCEMCPISQLEQSASLKQEGYELLGWFHSHPSFPPDPSRTDVQTQIEMQMQFAAQTDRTFLGLILSCLKMNFKCIYVLPKDFNSNLNKMAEPYELEVDIIKDCTNLKDDIRDVCNFINIHDQKGNLIEKFKCSSVAILTQYGYNPETFFSGIIDNF